MTQGQSSDSYFGVATDQNGLKYLTSFNYSTLFANNQALNIIGPAPAGANAISLDAPTNFTPEPGSISLLVVGLMGLGLYRWRSR